MKKVLMIVAPDNFRDEECFVPKEHFEKNFAQVVVASRGGGLKTGSLGATVGTVDYKKVNVSEFDAVVLVGGQGATVYYDDIVVHDIVKKAVEAGKVLAAICIAPVILARAGVLNRKNATVFPSGKIDIEAKGSHYTGKDVTVDGKIVTASGPRAALKFAEEIVKIW